MSDTLFEVSRDATSVPLYNKPWNDSGAEVLLAAVTEVTLTIPADVRKIYISYSSGSTVYVNYNDTAAVPSSGTFTASTQEINPDLREVVENDVIHFISEDPATVCVGYFRA